MSQTVMIAGCGDVGGRLGEALLADGWRVHGLRRSVDALPQGILPVAGDLQAPECPAQWPSEPLDYLVYSAAASQHDEAGYRAAYVDGLRHVLGWLQARGQRPRRLLFVSSTGVYAQTDGGWIDEESPALSQAYSGRIMLDAEQVALDSGIPATRVRLAGIYGPGREWLLNQVRQGYRVVSEPPLYANRIHADDAAGLLAFLLRADAGGQALEDCYIGVDDAPVAMHEVVDYLRQRLGVSQWADEHSVRRAGSKRCSNRRARALGWVPRYPSYREGYAAVLGVA
ncbi:SDR family oxidoreductase [Pseudomonas aeruginosa]|uniref:SDR family oxidoreductase n=1 Tax=Pseudomonas aeruginosa TaxID=287 RepID=UPI000449F8E8|nr:SDR family oxidoreductase [Pseudomonas aeruginosa]KAJ17295.1 oxidoreductase [Pseudomonas aeruginosa IGB83]MBH8741146.1 SDR family oxidoreductase [Pseudomonas aeruginosa]TRM15881.1 SDR family oxidoreductase [Pseudomonas aeruginosa]HDQ4519760.1 SDR family oxidoreductase [Pseudomonas aeruginosa]